jgi:putative CocE/NonD family hydrolase
MRTLTEFPRTVREIMTAWIPMPDGKRLAARIWLPADAESDPVPALLEYLPYRRRDGTSYRDSITQPYMAGHGYAAVRVDIRGTGDSEGLMLDEYDQPEQQDGVAVIEWLARQPWCTGEIGMWGISWGGFNALQVAALAPPALKAIMPMGFAQDRYNGDCHFMGGCLLEGNISWGGTMFAGNSRPPDPAVVGPQWREQWLDRLRNTPLPLELWLWHQRRDDYWKPGSVCEDYGRIQVPVYAVSGWQDSYSRNVLPLLQGLSVPKKALIGPWAHGWPHLGRPGPAIGFLQEALRWWDHWLKGRDTGIMDEPMLRVWMNGWVTPAKSVAEWTGRWVGEQHWPGGQSEPLGLELSDTGLGGEPLTSTVTVRSPLTVGLRAGYQCSYALGPDLSDDQRIDDGQSVCFDGAVLEQRVEILGAAQLELEVTCDRPQALLAARLCDVAPDGASLRVSYGLLNLSQRDSEAEPKPLAPGRPYRIRIELCGIAHSFAPGHRIRLALSSSYWPIAWPSPEFASLTLRSGRLLLPVREANPKLDNALRPFGEPEGAEAKALVETRSRTTTRSQDRIEEHLGEGRVDLVRTRDRGAWRTTDTDVEYDARGELRFEIDAADPLAARQSIAMTTELGRPGWRVRTETRTTLACTADAFLVSASLLAFEGDEQVFSRTWDSRIPRDNM